MEEKIYYQDSTVLVTDSRFVTGSKTDAMRNISSVYIGTIPANFTFHVIGIFIGLLMLFFGGIIAKVIGGVLIVALGYAITKTKPDYTVRINSNSGEVNSLISKDRQYIEQIVGGINSAIIGH